MNVNPNDSALRSFGGGVTLTRRRALGLAVGLGAAAAAAACSSRSAAPSTPQSSPTADQGLVRWANWPSNVDPQSLQELQNRSDFRFQNEEVINDMTSFTASIQAQMAAGLDPGFDAVILDSAQSQLFAQRGWLQKFDKSQMPNLTNNVLPFFKVDWDPNFDYHAPYTPSAFSLGYSASRTGRPITSYEDMLDPKFAGKVGLYSGFRETYSLFALLLRRRGEISNTPDKLTVDDVKKVNEFLKPHFARGQFRVTGYDYLQGLASGDLWLCFITTADPTILGNPDVQFTYASEGSLALIDSIVIPTGSPNRVSAQKLIDFWYDPVNAARLVTDLHYQTPVAGTQALVRAKDPALAANPLAFPPPDVQDQIYGYPNWNNEQIDEISRLWETLTGR